MFFWSRFRCASQGNEGGVDPKPFPREFWLLRARQAPFRAEGVQNWLPVPLLCTMLITSSQKAALTLANLGLACALNGEGGVSSALHCACQLQILQSKGLSI